MCKYQTECKLENEEFEYLCRCRNDPCFYHIFPQSDRACLNISKNFQEFLDNILGEKSPKIIYFKYNGHDEGCTLVTEKDGLQSVFESVFHNFEYVPVIIRINGSESNPFAKLRMKRRVPIIPIHTTARNPYNRPVEVTRNIYGQYNGPSARGTAGRLGQAGRAYAQYFSQHSPPIYQPQCMECSLLHGVISLFHKSEPNDGYCITRPC